MRCGSRSAKDCTPSRSWHRKAHSREHESDRTTLARLKTAQGTLATFATIVATWWQLGLPRVVFSSEIMAIHARIDALEAFNRDTRLLVLDQTLVER